jgi:hypothetical protein
MEFFQHVLEVGAIDMDLVAAVAGVAAAFLEQKAQRQVFDIALRRVPLGINNTASLEHMLHGHVDLSGTVAGINDINGEAGEHISAFNLSVGYCFAREREKKRASKSFHFLKIRQTGT